MMFTWTNRNRHEGACESSKEVGNENVEKGNGTDLAISFRIQRCCT